MHILLIKANQSLYASKGTLNEALFILSKQIFETRHAIRVSDVASGVWDVDKEIDKLKWADIVIYHFPLWWFGIPHLLKKYFDEVLVYGKTYRLVEIYGEGGMLTGKAFMIAVTSNAKKSAFGNVPMLTRYRTVDDLLTPLILTNYYVGIRRQLPTFHAEDVVRGDTSGVLDDYAAHLAGIAELTPNPG